MTQLPTTYTNKFYCNIFVFLFNIKDLIFFMYSGGSVGCMRVCVNRVLVFVRVGCD